MTNLFEDTGGGGEEIIPILSRWARDADFKIRNFRSWERINFTATINGCRVDLPDSAVHVPGLIFGEYDEDCEAIFTGAYLSNQTIIETHAEDIIFNWDAVSYNYIASPWRISDNKIIFSCDMDQQKVTIDLIKYTTDQDGFIMVPEINLEPITFYLKKMYADLIRWTSFRKGRLKYVDNQFIKELKTEFNTAVRNARALDEGPGTEETILEISKLMHHPLKGFGNAVIQDIWR